MRKGEDREMSEAKKETILVTGTSGRIGYAIAKRLGVEQQSFNVIGFDRKAPSHPLPSAECLTVDLTNDESTRARAASHP